MTRPGRWTIVSAWTKPRGLRFLTGSADLAAGPGWSADRLVCRRARGEGDDMIWAILALLGVPLWLCAIGIFALVFRNRTLRRRHGNLPVRVRRPGKTRWTRGHAIWISDVFAWRGSPAAWSEDLLHV